MSDHSSAPQSPLAFASIPTTAQLSGRGRGRGRGAFAVGRAQAASSNVQSSTASLSLGSCEHYMDDSDADSRITYTSDESYAVHATACAVTEGSGSDTDISSDTTDTSNSECAGQRVQPLPKCRHRQRGGRTKTRLPSAAGLTIGGPCASAVHGSSQHPREQCPPSPTSQRRAAYKQLFPVRGVRCVGCMIGKRLDPVTSYVHEHVATMPATTLFKMAALVYKRTVVAECKEAGVQAPPFAWRDMRRHYQMHCIDSSVNRCDAIRTLQAMRMTLQHSGVLRVTTNDDLGTSRRELDKNATELYLKILAQEDRERASVASVGFTTPAESKS